MPITDLFTQEITVQRTTTYVVDDIGGTTTDDETIATVQGYLQPRIGTEPRSGTEDMADRNTQIGNWVLYLPPDTDVDGWDRVTHLSHTFDVIAPPQPFWDPRNEEVHHLEVELREVI